MAMDRAYACAGYRKESSGSEWAGYVSTMMRILSVPEKAGIRILDNDTRGKVKQAEKVRMTRPATGNYFPMR
jgi:hypothetical protein